jgi:hypothetical protein
MKFTKQLALGVLAAAATLGCNASENQELVPHASISMAQSPLSNTTTTRSKQETDAVPMFSITTPGKEIDNAPMFSISGYTDHITDETRTNNN